MRFTAKPYPEIGSKRTVRRFLLFPVTINDETRWLEWVTLLQVREGAHYCDGEYCPVWTNIEFLPDAVTESTPNP